MSGESSFLLPAGRKMRLLSQETQRLSDLQFKLLFILFDQVDRSTGLTIISHQELADRAACGKRAVEQNVQKLCELGCVEAARNEVGRRRDGSSVFGGRGYRNRYRLVSATLPSETGSRAQRPFVTTVLKDRSALNGRPPETTQKTVFKGTPPYTLESSHKNSLPREDRGANIGSAEWVATAWHSVQAKLAWRLGDAKALAWSSRMRVVTVSETECVLAVQTKFIRSQINQQLLDHLTDAWASVVPGIREVRLIVEVEASATEADRMANSAIAPYGPRTA